ncbi:vitamin D3 hydroxylase-associated protein-like [Lineus longissimus]|uniref:vitamin D3 hydroxylase-associated protein-like n=1 Tax=Lineus longissimus TaxID=88925 RepID=UPI00315DBE65
MGKYDVDELVLKYGSRYVTKKLSSEVFWKEHWVLSCTVGTIGAVCLGQCANYLYQWYRLYTMRTLKSEMARDSKTVLRDNLAKMNSKAKWEHILCQSFEELVEKLQSQQLKAVDVLHAFQWKALDVDTEINCVTEPISGAEAVALECDRSDVPLGPLHGIPVSLEECLPIKGYVSTSGASKYAGDVCSKDCLVVHLLKKLGAVPFMKTNVPQVVLSYQCSNPIFGRTVNPLDVSRTPGGAAGGEGALISVGGSCLGFGTDVCGGIRIPASMCGIASFKPTGLRLSRSGIHASSKIPPQIFTSIGPLARDVKALVMATRSLLGPELFAADLAIPPLPFNTGLFEDNRKLRIGYYIHDGYVQPVPACVRAVELAKKALERQGHTLVPWQPPRVKYAMEVLFVNAMIGDHGRSFFEEIRHDKIDSSAGQLYYRLMIPEFVRKIISNMLRPQCPTVSKMLSAGLRLGSIYDYWVLSGMIDDYKEEFLLKWQDSELDAVICPGFATPALSNEVSSRAMSSYPALYNLVDFPAGSIPITRVTAADDEELETSYPATDLISKLVRRFASGSENLPVNVQCVSLPWRGEVCLRVMKELQDEIGQFSSK